MADPDLQIRGGGAGAGVIQTLRYRGPGQPVLPLNPSLTSRALEERGLKL